MKFMKQNSLEVKVNIDNINHFTRLCLKTYIQSFINMWEEKYNFKFIKITFIEPTNYASVFLNYAVIEYEGKTYRLDFDFWTLYPNREHLNMYNYHDNLVANKIFKDIKTLENCNIDEIPLEDLSDRFFLIKHHLLGLKCIYWLIYYNKDHDFDTLNGENDVPYNT